MIENEISRLVQADRLLGRAVVEAWDAINETKMSRLHQGLTQTEAPYAILTAFRNEFDYKENVARNEELKKDLRDLGLSWKRVQGGWMEGDKPVTENSFLVIQPDSWRDEGFKNKMVQLIKKYGQDAFTYKPRGEDKILFVDQSGNADDYGIPTSSHKYDPSKVDPETGERRDPGFTGQYRKPGQAQRSPSLMGQGKRFTFGEPGV